MSCIELEGSNAFEPLARDYPDLGPGGGRQVLIGNQEINIKAVWDISVNPPKLKWDPINGEIPD
jgi:hypothetical protein